MGLVSSIYNDESKMPPVTGRKDGTGQEAKLEPTAVKDAWKELVALQAKARAAGAQLSFAVKAIAKKSGFNASSLRRALNARAESDDAAKKAKRDAEQLSILIDETAEFGESQGKPQ